ncbi:MAG: hypothetical protein ACI9JM_003302 [Halioglobus sp.]|jgi:hypothetical protein
MFGTFAPERDEVTYGLRTNVNTFNAITITFMDWAALFRKMHGASSVAVAIGYFLAHPIGAHRQY